jgi:23S rRNA pseudouridine1911/1915/1917 synthase
VSLGQVVLQVAKEGERLDRYLAVELAQHSRARIQDWIRQGLVEVDGEPVRKPAFRLEAGQRIRVTVPPAKPAGLTPEPIPLDIIYEDDRLIVINKRPGIVVHPSAGHPTGTLVHAVLAHSPQLKGVGGVARPGVVHRLDKDTSGLLIMAKDDRTHQALQAQFKARKVKKSYLAIVDGHPPTPTGRIEVNLGRDPRNRKRMAVRPGEKGREAVTIYRTLETFPRHALLELEPLTGRTHQLRVHLAFLGCPVVGDRTYGRRKPSLPVQRHCLHAAKLVIILPGEAGPRTFEAPLPEDMQRVLDSLRRA